MKLSLFALAAVAYAQRPTNTSICDYYTTALLKTNNATNQYTLLTLVVNTAVIGNYTKPNVGIAVPGILNPKGSINGTSVNLVPYFSGALKSSNRGGKSGVSVNFLDDGGAVPLMMNKPANGTSSNQYELLTHLYEYFGALLGCSEYGKTGYPAYGGETNMYEVHKFMALDYAEVSYFIQQVGLSAASFGVAAADVAAVGAALNGAFNHKCSPPAAIIPKQPAQLEAICTADDCPLAANATCSSYAKVVDPSPVSSSATSSSTATSTSSASSTATFSGAASKAELSVGLMAGLVGVVGLVL